MILAVGATTGTTGFTAFLAATGVNATTQVGKMVFSLASMSLGNNQSSGGRENERGSNEGTKKTKSTNSGENSKRRNTTASGTGGGNDPEYPGGSNGSGHQNDENSDSNSSNDENSCDENDFTSTESREISLSGEFENENRREIRYRAPHGGSHRYYRIRRHLSGTGDTFETDHVPSLATLKKLLNEVIPYIRDNNVPRQLERVVRMLQIMFRTNDLLSINVNNIRGNYGRILFGIFNVKSVHRGQESTGFSFIQFMYIDEVANLFLSDNFVAAFERIFRDYHNTIIAQLSSLTVERIETLYDWMLSYVDYLYRRKIITKEEKECLEAYLNKSEDKVINAKKLIQ